MQLPSALISSLLKAPGFDAPTFEAAHAAEEKITSIRFNPAKLQQLSESPVTDTMQPVPWSSGGYYLASRPSFTFDPLFHAGLYYVQEASGMFLEQALRQSVDLLTPLKVLDLCAAPGGKSTLIQSLLTKESLLVSNDVIRSRAAILEENMIKWGAANVVVTNNDPRDFQKLPGFFDVIVIDAPCSGSGLFRRDPYLVKEWSLANVELCCQRQQRILADVLPALREGGILIYSTCSYSAEENEDIVDWLMQELPVESMALQYLPAHGMVETVSAKGGYGYRFYPDKVKGEGLFITVLRLLPGKAMDTIHRTAVQPPSHKFEKIVAEELALLRHWLTDAGSYQYIKFKNEILAVPLSWGASEKELLSLMYVKKAGIKTGEMMSGALVPDHQLAVSGLVSTHIPSIELDEEDAVRYLKKETMQLNTQAKGWMLVKYKGLALGWVKALQNRVNNYYPKEWRILKKER